MVERARLESVYTSKVYRGFESLSLRKFDDKICQMPANSDVQAFFIKAGLQVLPNILK